MNWTVLCEEEENRAWRFIFDTCLFDSNNKKGFCMKLPIPNICFDIAEFYNDSFNEELYANLHLSAIKWFKNLAPIGKLIALDLHHECYSFDPYKPFETDEFGEWLTPVFPNGDYLFFLTKDFSNGIFADGINLQISIWGLPLIDLTKKYKSTMLENARSCV